MWKLFAAGRRARPAIFTVLALVLAASGWFTAAAATATAAPEYQLKAVFLFNFTQFVEWPPAQPATPFVIGILGEDPFNEALDETLRGETAGERPIVVERYRRVEDIGNCQILFIAQSQAGELKSVLTMLRGRPILTVSDLSTFAEQGGTIQFVTLNNKLKLRINAQSAAVSNLAISSKLMRLADVVATQPESGRD